MNFTHASRIKGGMRVLLASALVSGALFSPAAIAAQQDLDLIQSYVGEWRGRGTLNAPGQSEETVVCRLSVTKSSPEKINYSGRCTLAGGNMSINGTMAYINSHSEAVLTSNTSFSGTAIGTRRGKNVTFNLRAKDDAGKTSNVEATFGLQNDNIVVGFVVTQADGSKLVAHVPFKRR